MHLLLFEFYCFVSAFVVDKAIFANGRYMAASKIIILPNRKWRWRSKQIQRDNTDSMKVKTTLKNKPFIYRNFNFLPIIDRIHEYNTRKIS